MAPSAGQGIDPWGWDTDRVVKELCTGRRSWKPLENPPILPDPIHLESGLRENLINGVSLLKDADDPSFFQDLGVKANKHKNTLREAISQFQQRSPMYKKYLLKQEQQDEDEDMSDTDSDDLEDIESRKRKLQAERMSQALEAQAALPLEPVRTPTLVAEAEAEAAEVTATALLDLDGLKENGHTKSMPVDHVLTRKKRRIEPLQVLDQPLGLTTRAIPTQADIVIENLMRDGILRGNPFLEAPIIDTATTSASTSGHGTSADSWYLGKDSLTRVDVIDFDSSRLTDADMTFVFRKRVPIGRRRQVNQLHKRRIQRQDQDQGQQQQLEHQRRGLPPLWTSKPRINRPLAKTDAVFGTDDPNHNSVLPLLGDSDSGEEYDSDTWAEIEAEQKEREVMLKANTALATDDINAALDECITEYVAAWTERKLPKLEQRANIEWNAARRTGLKRALDTVQREVIYLQTRLAGFRAEVHKQEWRTRAEIKSTMGNFEPTVQDLQASLWTLKVLKSPSEPKRVSNVSRKPAKKREQRPRPIVSDDEGDLVMSDSDDDFIVEDEEGHAPLPEETSYDEMAIDSENIAVANNPGSIESETLSAEFVTHGSVGLSTPIDDNESEVQNVVAANVAGNGHADEHSRSTPSIFDILETHNGARDDHALEETTDLTRVGLSPTPSRPDGSNPSGTPPQFKAPEPIIPTTFPLKKSSLARETLIEESPGLSPMPQNRNEQLVKDALRDLPEPYQPLIVQLCRTHMAESKTDKADLWVYYIIPLLGHRWTGPPFDDRDNDRHYYVACYMTRAFDLYSEGCAPSIRKYWQITEEQKQYMGSRTRQFSEFMTFFCKVVKDLRRSVWNRPLSSTSVGHSANAKSNDKSPGPEQPEELGAISEDSDEDTEDEPAVSPTKKRRPIQRDRAAQNLRDSDKARVKEQAKRRELLRAKLAAQGHSEASQNLHLLINESKEDDQGFIYVPDNIASRIKKHQVEGVRFMWNQLVADSQSRQGCLLAHTMGLGKTMQIITLLVTIADAAASNDPAISKQIPDELKESRTLILAPPGLINNWTDELLVWIPDGHPILGNESENLYKIDADTSIQDRHNQIVDWANYGGILVIGYALFKACALIPLLAGHLFDEANIVVADEAHMLKSEKSQIHNAAIRFRTRTRIALTGSPLANNVKEYHSMLSWVCPGYLSNRKEFDHDYARPIEEGLSVDSTRAQKRKALTKLRALKETVAPKVHRRTIAVLHHDVPPKMEFVVSVPLTKLQRDLYETYIRFNQSEDKGSMKLLAGATTLTVLCNHPDAFRALLKEQRQKGSAKDKPDDPDDKQLINLPPVLVSELLQMMPARNLRDASYSSKMLLLDRILDESKNKGDKVLIFSQSMKTLDYLEKLLRLRRRHYLRLDGSTSASKRPAMVRDFNAVESNYEVFLISTTAGGLGLNITSANRVVIMDSKWNPQQEQQAVGRAFRIGQTKPVFVYRLLCGGTLEMKLHHRQIFKMQLAQRVVDDQKPIPKAQRLAELFAMPSDPEPGEVTEHLGKDIVLDSILNSELGSHVKSIVMTDTFEEEALEEEVLAQDEEMEAQRLINDFHARQGRTLPSGGAASITAAIAQQQYQASMVAASNPQQTGPSRVNSSQPPPVGFRSAAPVLATPALATPSQNVVANGAFHIPVHHQPVRQPASPSLPASLAKQHLQGSGSVAPVPGATTQLRQAGDYWDNLQAFKGELGRVFSAKRTGADASRLRAVAQEVAAAFGQQQHQRQLQGVREAKWAVMDSSASPRFVEAIVAGLLTPNKLALMEANDIVNRRAHWDNLPQESWEQEISTHRHKIHTTVGIPHPAFSFASSTSR
ncbi:hypothetical protein PG999_006440 [Apiospora kogelbergensis]|uniref:Uncharacterized protein n=1 Tax=Apiospora kogelbergensis TaxID=1337665 RepID=A0AAW0QS06_9PEZI